MLSFSDLPTTLFGGGGKHFQHITQPSANLSVLCVSAVVEQLPENSRNIASVMLGVECECSERCQHRRDASEHAEFRKDLNVRLRRVSRAIQGLLVFTRFARRIRPPHNPQRTSNRGISPQPQRTSDYLTSKNALNSEEN